MTAPKYFPPPELADEEGLIHIGGRLTTPWLLDAYRHGIFPWPMNEDFLAWFSPDPRAVIEFDRLYVSRRLARTCRSDRFQVTANRAFADVMRNCGTAQDREFQTWVTAPMLRAYTQLHRQGFAHSVEVWHQGVLAGGTYGVSIGGLFAAESMFYQVRDASKVALVHLVAHLRSRGYQLLDIQQLTSHTRSLGATEIPRTQYLRRVRQVRDLPVTFGQQLCGDLTEYGIR